MKRSTTGLKVRFFSVTIATAHGWTRKSTGNSASEFRRFNLVHVPYHGAAPALTDLLGDRIQVAFLPMPGSIEYIRTGTLHALAVTAATRSDQLPDIPTIGDFVPGYEASVCFGVGAPKNTPVAIIDKLNRAIDAGLADAKMKARLADLGATVFAGAPEDFGKLIADETEKWGKVIRTANIAAE
ncbi:MAG: tripartite tricarboxylate transporter substrate-binding protein [Xanthobacteraceae bacterium]